MLQEQDDAYKKSLEIDRAKVRKVVNGLCSCCLAYACNLRSHLIMHQANGLLSDYIGWTNGLSG